MTVLRAYNVPEGLEIVRTHLVDVVLLDVKMPGMDCPAVLAVRAELKQISPAPWIILVNEDDWATREARLKAAGGGWMFDDTDRSVKISDYAKLLARIQGQLQAQLIYRDLEEKARTSFSDNTASIFATSTAIEPTKPPGTER